MNKEYEIYYEAFDIEDREKRKKFILEKCGGDKKFFDNIMKLFPDEAVDEDTYGKYKIEREIGRGGMGIVYLASYTETFENDSFTKQVALKTISPEQKIDSKNIKKLLQEIKTLAELEHPNIARFLDIGTSEKGKPFLIMEYVNGLSVTDYCDKNKFSIKERLDFFREVLGAIEYSHSKGFIHCDIKPNNIIVDAKGTPKVIDFGIASKYGSLISDKSYHTTFFQNAFTINYASPEQIKGEQHLTEATDIYSLGVVLYELLTGQLPIKFDETKSYQQLISTAETYYPVNLKKSINTISDDDKREKIVLERDCQSLSDLKENLTTDLDEIVQKAFSKKVRKRYKSVNAFDSEIEEYLSEDSFIKQIRRAFALLYKKTARRLRRIPMKWAFASIIGLILIPAILLQNNTVRTVPYYLQFRFAENAEQIKLSESQTEAMENSISNLKNSLSVDLDEAVSQFNEGRTSEKHNAWGLSDLINGLSRANYPLDKNQLNSVLENLAASDECWKEEKVACKMAVSGWVLLSKNRLGKPVSDQQIEFILKNQSEEGWFPAYPYPDSKENASTYPTAVIILGLTEHLKSNLISQNYKERVKTAVEKGALWILKTRSKPEKGLLWSDCPNNDPVSQTRSDGLDGMVIYALHTVEKSNLFQIQNLSGELKEIDSLWLNHLGNMSAFNLEYGAECRCGTNTGDGVILDRTTQWAIPWSIIATVEAFPNGTLWQKAVAKKWLENLPFSKQYNGYYYGAAEYLIALSHLRESNS